MDILEQLFTLACVIIFFFFSEKNKIMSLI